MTLKRKLSGGVHSGWDEVHAAHFPEAEEMWVGLSRCLGEFVPAAKIRLPALSIGGVVVVFWSNAEVSQDQVYRSTAS